MTSNLLKDRSEKALMISRSETKIELGKHLASGGSYENVSKNNFCSHARASVGGRARKQFVCQVRSRRPWATRGDRVMAWTGMGAGVVGIILLPTLLSVLCSVLCGAADSYPATARGIRSASASDRTTSLLVLLPESARLLPVCKTVPQRMVEGCTVSTQSTFFTAIIKE